MCGVAPAGAALKRYFQMLVQLLLFSGQQKQARKKKCFLLEAKNERVKYVDEHVSVDEVDRVLWDERESFVGRSYSRASACCKERVRGQSGIRM